MTPDQLTSQTCRIVTRGRRTGAEHVVQVWFAVAGSRFYAASRHGRAGDWLQNALHHGSLEVRSGRHSFTGASALVPPSEVPLVLDLFAAKYHRHPSVISAWRAEPPVLVRADLT